MLKNQFYLQMPAEWTLKKTVKNAAEFVLFCFFFKFWPKHPPSVLKEIIDSPDEIMLYFALLAVI